MDEEEVDEEEVDEEEVDEEEEEEVAVVHGASRCLKVQLQPTGAPFMPSADAGYKPSPASPAFDARSCRSSHKLKILDNDVF